MTKFYWLQFPFVRYVFFLIIGIIIEEFTGIEINAIILILTISVIVCAHYFLLRFKRLSWVSPLYLFVLTLTGVYFHGMNRVNEFDFPEKGITGFSGIISSEVNKGLKFYKFQLNLNYLSIDHSWKDVKGKVIVYLRYDSTQQANFNFGDKIYLKGHLQRISGPSNPKVFDYRQFMDRKGIAWQYFGTADQIQKIGKGKINWLLAMSLRIRSRIVQVLDKHIENVTNRAIIKALIVGDKEELSLDIQQQFATAGAMHILAVSGLHVGILYLIITHVLSLFSKSQRISKEVIALLFLWLYAFVTGFSPSVLRAVFMFSIVGFGNIINRRPSIYNSIAVAAFFMLLYNTQFLFMVGFQLSFIAVWGIIYFYPRLYNMLYFKRKVFDYIWSLTCVGIAAQLVTFPLGLYYFKQFPTYFFISNLLIVPLISMVLSTGIFFILFSEVPILSSVILFLLDLGLSWIRINVAWVSSIPGNKILIDFISVPQVIILYAMIIVIAFLIQKRFFYQYLYLFFLFFLLVLWDMVILFQRTQTTGIMVYKINNQSAIDFFYSRSVVPIADIKPINQSAYNYTIKVFRNYMRGTQKEKKELYGVVYPDYEVYVVHGKVILYLKRDIDISIKPDWLILSNNQLISVELIKKMSPELIILDSSYDFKNEKSMLNTLKAIPVEKVISIRQAGGTFFPVNDKEYHSPLE